MTEAIPTPATGKAEVLMGWGRNRPACSMVHRPRTTEQLQRLIQEASRGGLIARGLGRSYGDAAQRDGAGVIDVGAFNHLALDRPAGTLTAGGGASLAQILQTLVPQGLFLPVAPGTRNITVGGAIAADVHGKNHHVDGSFGAHVRRLSLVDGLGEIRELHPDGTDAPIGNALFWATVAGMGLTGVVTEATFSVIPITSSMIRVDTSRHHDIDSLMEAMVAADSRHRYSVAWIDSLHPRGRSVLTCGDHATAEQLPAGQRSDPLAYNPRALATPPPIFPGGLLNAWTVGAFNEAWYRKAPRCRTGELQAIAPFFHPLDGIKDWNRIYGPAGLLQYQFVVPNGHSALIPRVLAVLREAGAPSFLTVLKRFGATSPAPLSFPSPGWTLAADIPAAVPGLARVLERLDEDVAAAGGRLYLAKDSRQSARMFAGTYPRLEEWRVLAEKLDPRGVFQSDLGERLQLKRS